MFGVQEPWKGSYAQWKTAPEEAPVENKFNTLEVEVMDDS
jgi:hypothetical protein